MTTRGASANQRGILGQARAQAVHVRGEQAIDGDRASAVQDKRCEQEQAQDGITERRDVGEGCHGEQRKKERRGTRCQARRQQSTENDARRLPDVRAIPEPETPQQPGEPHANDELIRRKSVPVQPNGQLPQGTAERDRRTGQVRRDEVIEGKGTRSPEHQKPQQRHPIEMVSELLVGQLEKSRRSAATELRRCAWRARTPTRPDKPARCRCR